MSDVIRSAIGSMLSPLYPYLYFIILPLTLIFLFTFKRIRRIAFATGFVIAGFLIVLFAIWSLIFWPPIFWLFKRVIPVIALAHGLEGILKIVGSMARNPLIRGDRLRTAERLWPSSKFGFLYRNIPDDIERPLIEDGKLIGGVSTTWLADRYVTLGIIESGVTASVFSFLVIIIPAILYYLLIVIAVSLTGLGNSFATSPPVIESWPDLPPVTVSPLSWHILLAGTALKFSWVFLLQNAKVLENWAMLAIGIALIMLPGIIYAWRAAKGGKYQMNTKDADVRWPYRAEIRQVLNTTYNRQVELASGYLKDSPLFRIGEATGTLRLRGDLSAPVSGQMITIDRDSLFQHLLVLGGTGEGKTSGILRPLMRQLLLMPNYGMYVCDAKGVLWRDALKIAEETGRGGDVVIIGTGAGQLGVDPIAELTPTQIVATLRSVLRQIGGGESESFWPDMGANILRHVFTVARSYAKTPEGRDDTAKGLNPYSLWWAYQAILNEETLKAAIGCIAKAELELKAAAKSAETEAEFLGYEAAFHDLVPTDLKATVSYLEGAWAGLAKDTKSGIIANVTQLLDGFSGANVLRDRFASGRSESTISLTEALRGKIVLNALSSVEDGLPARLVIMLLKTTLYREARVREAEWKALTPQKNPQDEPCIVIMDEVQEIATSDPTSGLSDATFWNVARSSGLAGIFATQTIAALEQAMGEESAANFLQQARSKIFFRSEDKATVEYACWCAGEFERDRVFHDGLYESVEFKEMLTNESYLEPVNENEKPKIGPFLFFQIGWNMIRLRQFSWDIMPVKPFVGTEPGAPATFGPADDTLARFSANRQAVWREEDREWQYRTTGNNIVAALTPADLIGMGRWHAYAHVQRAGAVRQDLVVVRHEHD